ncbi:MAG: hypothetical protein AMS20_00135 [Gemmatimonas sp. SG8_28]|nr:MAG: hypothetical protein AMS20_00135 [Gemmatimonas sp. SG8_28]
MYADSKYRTWKVLSVRARDAETITMNVEVGFSRTRAVVQVPRHRFKGALARMEHKRKSVFLLRHLNESGTTMTFREIARTMGFSSTRAQQLLREAEAGVLAFSVGQTELLQGEAYEEGDDDDTTP